MSLPGSYIRGAGQAPASVLGVESSSYLGALHIKRQAEVRPASPVESELNRITDELARLEGLMHSLVGRLEPVTVCKAAGQASCGNPPYDGCQIGARINGAATQVRDIADKLDSLLSALQV